MNKYKKALLIGMVLGDGSIKKQTRGNKTYGHFSMTHQVKQKDFIEYKTNLLAWCLNQQPPKIANYSSTTKFGFVDYYKVSKMHPYFRVLRRWIYPKDKKYISRKILNYLTPQAIAIWYMDDGGLSKGKNYVQDELRYSCEMRISTYFSKKEAEDFMAYFKEKWNIQSKMRYSKKTNSYYMAFNTTESIKFEFLIKDYILPSMYYKLPSTWNPRALDTTK